MDVTNGLAGLKNPFGINIGSEMKDRKILIFGIKLIVGKSIYFSGSSGTRGTRCPLAKHKSTTESHAANAKRTKRSRDAGDLESWN